MILDRDLGQEVAKNQLGLISITSVDHGWMMLNVKHSICLSHKFIISCQEMFDKTLRYRLSLPEKYI